MLVTKVGGLEEVVPHGKAGYVVDVSVKDIADALADFYQNDRKGMMSDGARAEKARFSWSSLTRCIETLYGEL